MSTLTSMKENSPVRVLQVLADFSQGTPAAGTVFVGERRHMVAVRRTAEGLIARCKCSDGCPAGPEAIQAVQIMADVWGRGSRMGTDSEASGDGEPESGGGLDQQRHRGPYDGLARATCEADLYPTPIPVWAYDEKGIRRSLCEAIVAAHIWRELDYALDHLLGKCPGQSADLNYPRYRQQSGFNGSLDVLRHYQASWEPMLRLSESAYEVHLLPELGGLDEQPR